MAIRIGINGFGRMGRLVFRVAWEWPELEIVHINEVKGGPQTAAHLLEFDSIHGRWAHALAPEEDALHVDGRRLSFSEFPTPGEVPWEEFQAAKNWYALIKSRPSFRPLLKDRVAGFTPSGTYADLDF